MILKASFGNLTKPGSSKDFIPHFGTDYGICSIIKPQTVFDPKLEKVHYKDKTFGEHINIKTGAEVGRKNGLTILLDTETFDYSFHPRQASEGFKIAIHHHLDQPIMSIKEMDTKTEAVQDARATEYRSLAARANYLSLDRTDLLFTTRALSKAMKNPSEQAWRHSKHLMFRNI